MLPTMSSPSPTGTNVEAAKQILIDSKLPIISAEDLDDAAQKAVKAISE